MSLSPKVIAETAAERVAPLQAIKNNQDGLLVHEIYASIQGESTFAGVPCTFIRLTGCHLRCSYCDTEHAFHHGEVQTKEAIHAQVEALGIPTVELTGGEPLLQKNALSLMKELCDKGYQVLLETSGAVAINKVDPRVKVILDVKTPDSGESDRFIEKNLSLLWPGCELKFVLGGQNDYIWAKQWLKDKEVPAGIPILFSPVADSLSPKDLAEWIMADKLPVRFQIQMHKILWGDEQGR